MQQSTRLNLFYKSLADKEWDDDTVNQAFRDAAAGSYSIWRSNDFGEYELWEFGFNFAKKLKKTDNVCYFELDGEDEVLIFKYRKIEDVICKIKKLLK